MTFDTTTKLFVTLSVFLWFAYGCSAERNNGHLEPTVQQGQRWQQSCPAIPGLAGYTAIDLVIGTEPWKKSLMAGMSALISEEHAKAERHFRLYLKEAEKFGPSDARLVHAVSALTTTLCELGKHAEAEEISKRYIKGK